MAELLGGLKDPIKTRFRGNVAPFIEASLTMPLILPPVSFQFGWRVDWLARLASFSFSAFVSS